MTEHALTGGDIDVCVDKTSGLGVIISGLEVVERGFGVVDIPPVAERVLCAQGARERAGAGKLLAPAIVSIFYYGIVAAVNEADDVALPIADIVVIGAVVVHGDHVPARVVAEQELVAARALRDQHRPVVAVVGGRAVDRLLRPQSVLVVGVGYGVRAVRCARQPAPLPRHRVAAVGGRVAACIVADVLAIVTRELIRPLLNSILPSKCVHILACCYDSTLPTSGTSIIEPSSD